MAHKRWWIGASLGLALGCGGDNKAEDVSAELPDDDASAPAPVDAAADAAVDAALDAALDAASDAAVAPLTQFSFKPSNFALAQLPAPPAGDLRIANRCEFDSESGRLSCSGGPSQEGAFSFAAIDGEQGVRLGVLRVRSLQVDMSGELHVRGGLPLVIAANEAIAVLGRISAAAVKLTPYAGGFPSAGSAANGKGPGGGQLGTVGQFKPSGGGSYCGVGGHGALTFGSTGAVANGGATYGSETLVPLLGGSSGGGAEGGAGGGALQIVSASRIQLGATGRIDAGGGGARNSASGGGAGGAILLEAPALQLSGVLAASGGGGSAARGGAGGQDGQDSALPAAGETGGDGTDLDGAGSAAERANGEDGRSQTVNDSLGGGGGAGRIRVNSRAPGSLTGTLSPSVATGCATEGGLTPL